MQTNLGLADADREGVLGTLRALLGDEYVLATRTRNYRWNVVGPQFHDLYELFGRQYRKLDRFADGVAERIRALGGRAPGTLAELLQHARLAEHPGRHPPAKDMVADLLAGHEDLVRHLRADCTACALRHPDAGTGAFLAGLMARHEVMARVLRAFLEVPEGTERVP
jgi:starvation-inducible DNA-binding protein